MCISDHSLIYAVCKYNTLKYEPKNLETIQFKNFNPDFFIEDIKNTPFHWAATSTEPNEMLDVFKFLVLELVNRHAPIRRA